MALKIRLKKQGRKNRPFYRLVVTDSRTPRDGKYVDMVGWYNPVEKESERVLNVNLERVEHWLGLGAQPTINAAALIERAAPDTMKHRRQQAAAKRAKVATKRKARSKMRREAAAKA